MISFAAGVGVALIAVWTWALVRRGARADVAVCAYCGKDVRLVDTKSHWRECIRHPAREEVATLRRTVAFEFGLRMRYQDALNAIREECDSSWSSRTAERALIDGELEPTCGDCGSKLTITRPGKWQCDRCG